MEQIYNNKMQAIGYDQKVCDIFISWEEVKDELLVPERKKGSGNGTIHVFLGAADEELRKEFPQYYASVQNEADAANGAIEIKHYFLSTNIISMLGYVCQYNFKHHHDIAPQVEDILSSVSQETADNNLLTTKSLFKLSTGASKLRPYFKQFESNGVFTKIIRKILLPNSAYKISLYKNNNNEYAAFWLIGFDNVSDFEADSNVKYLAPTVNCIEQACYQIIYYGAPGTGKSHAIKELTKGAEVIRTTFHPDSDYSTFVGAYKPTMGLLPICDELGQPMKIGSTVLHKEQIVYKFVDQAFLQAYVKAWTFYAEANSETPKNQYLIIEEINRGNCAQIFGDLFQLLDRNGSGFSDYPIKADNDMKNQLAKAFAGLEIAQRDRINSLYKDNEKDIVGQVLSGEKLLLPNNLYIWATMNTSDQSLFPIDSAFKRRWDWQYMPIGKGYDNNGNEYKWFVEIAGKKYGWWSFLEKINAQIAEATQSEDKKLGFFFSKAEDNKISAEKFVGKVIFYLWNDVFKDYGFEREIFKDIDGTELSFDKFYKADVNGNAIIQEDKVDVFLNNLKVELLDSADNTEEDEEFVDSNGTKIPKYSINGSSEQFTTPKAVLHIIEDYGRHNENISVNEMIELWNGISERNNFLVESWQPSPNDNQAFANKRRTKIEWKNGTVWMINGWTEALFKKFIDNVKQKLNISIVRVN